MRPESAGGLGHDAAWADDFHHALRTLLTGDREGYYAEFGEVAQLAKAFRRPHVHDGGFSTFRDRRFGAPADDVPPEGFVVFAANHDQVGNRAVGDRLPRELRPLAALCTLFAPFTPMIFQGEEYGEPAPFQFFTDHIDEDIAEATRNGRREEFASFAAFAGEDVPDPQARETFERSKLTREVDQEIAELHRRAIALRPELPPGDVDEVAHEDGQGGPWLRVRRGSHVLAANFAGEPRSVPVGAGTIAVATTVAAELREGSVWLPARSGAVVRLG
jgi:maltooligosyltrehalose trehalohydrolase